MAMEELIAALERDAAAKADDIRQKAGVESAELREAYAAELARRRESRLQARERELTTEAELALAGARRAGRQEVLLSREDFLTRVRHALADRVVGLDADPGYQQTVAGELAEAVTYLAPGPAEVRCSPALVGTLARAAQESAGREIRVVEDPSVGAGFVLRALDGHAEVDARLATRTERLWPELALSALEAAQGPDG